MIKTIKTITLTNFQSHKNSVIDVDSPIVILSGESNNGKSAILRGVLWLLTNRPSGIGFVSNWAKETNTKSEIVLKKDAVCSVSINYKGADDTEHTITRLRSRDKNVYIVDGVELEAVGTAVPDEVLNLTTMHDCNIQSQDDSYFMLTLPAGQVASKLNELVHLDSIDRAYEYTKKCKTSASAVYKEWCALAASCKTKLDGLKHVPELANTLVEIEAQVSELEDTQDLLDSAHQQLEDLLELKRNIEHSTVDCDLAIEHVEDSIDDYNHLTYRYGKAVALYTTYTNIMEQINDVPELDVDELKNSISTYYAEQDKLSEAVQLLDRYDITTKELKECIANINYLESELPPVCPLCGHTIDKEEL